MSTIVSISTAPGIGGIGIIRMSGEKSFEILDKIFKPKTSQKIEDIKGYTIKYGHIVENNEIIDEVLVSYFKAPRSYTTENMCEINSHGGNVVVKKILEICLKNGAELAEPGEFTKRAFLNGRIDLAQAESVIDVINAKSDKEAKSGIKQLEGYLSKEIKGIKQEILDVLVNIEVTIDYPEYDTPEVQEKEIAQILESVGKKLKKLEKSFDNGKIIKDGIKTAIIGKPNAGKSSLMNVLLGEERAIVTEIAGTTRDTLEEHIYLQGISLNVVDTAGIRDTEDIVEKIGVERAMKAAEDADLIIYVVDGSRALDENDKEIMEFIRGRRAIVLLNKTDLKLAVDKDELENACGHAVIPISAKEEQGIEALEEEIKRLFYHGKISFNEQVYITNVRHKEALEQTLDSLKMVKQSVSDGMPEDFYSIDLMNAYEQLGKILGEAVEDDLVNEIFSKFCMGK